MLEIGLGCDMQYGPGASATLWRSYFPEADLWFAEYNGERAHLFLHLFALLLVLISQFRTQPLLGCCLAAATAAASAIFMHLCTTRTR
jgi:hypothetical protein